MVSSDQRNQSNIEWTEPENFTVVDDVHRVFVVRPSTYVQTCFMEQSGRIKNRLPPSTQAVFFTELFKQCGRQRCNVLSTRKRDVVFASEFTSGMQDLFAKPNRPAIMSRHFVQQRTS